MRRHARGDLRLQCLGGHRRVVKEAQLVVVARVLVRDQLFLVLRKVQAFADDLEDRSGNIAQLPVEAGHELPEAREDGLGDPNVRLRGILLAADFVAFLRT
jgi:hypothetical protein